MDHSHPRKHVTRSAKFREAALAHDVPDLLGERGGDLLDRIPAGLEHVVGLAGAHRPSPGSVL
jgi:hypothetical protein